MLINKFLKTLSTQKRYSNHTIAAYAKDLEQLQMFLSNTFEIQISPKEVHQIRHVHLRSWIAAMAEQSITAKSIARKLSSVKSFFKYLHKTGIVEKNIATKLSAPKISKSLPAFVLDTQMQLLFENVVFPDGFAGIRDRMVLEILYLTGLRREELINIEDDDINFEKNTIKITGKGNKQRILPLHKNIIEKIKDYQNERNQSFEHLNHSILFVTNKGKQMYPNFVYRLVKKYLAAITTLEKKSPHILRHTFATHLSNNGADLNAIKELLGHSSLAATQVYTHNSIKKLKDIYKQAHPKA